MPNNTQSSDGLTDGTYTEAPREVVLGVEGAAAELADFPFQEFTDLAPTITSASLAAPLFDFGVSVFNAADASFDSYIDDIGAVTSAALELLSDVIIGADGSSIEVAVTINPELGSGTVANATAGSFYFGPIDENGFAELFTSAQLELQQGIDLNGARPDIIININPEFLLGASFDTDPARVATEGVIDFVSVLVHEVIHSLGFLSVRDNTGEDRTFDIDGDGVLETFESTFGKFVKFNEEDGLLTPTFNGGNAVKVYGEGVVLESTFDSPGSDISHFALFNPDDSLADTALALLNPTVIPGDIVSIGALELAVFEDLGYTVAHPEGVGLVNPYDSLPFTPTVSVNQQLTADGNTIKLTFQFDSASLFNTLPSSVGVTVVDADGAEQTLRAQFALGETSVSIELDAAEFFTLTGPDGFTSVSGDVEVTLFFPAQATLANGEQTETVTVSANLISGSDAADNIVGGYGDDQLFGGSGDDNIEGGSGDDFIGAGDDNDTIDGVSGLDTVLGGAGDDNIMGGSDQDLLFGGEGNDSIDGSHANDTLSGGPGDDYVDGGDGHDVIDGGDGSDTLVGNYGDDLVFGGSGDDDVNGGDGSDTIDAGAGSDIVVGGHGDDLLLGGSGDDNISGGTGADIIAAGSGSDTLEGGDGIDDFVLSFGDAGDTDVILDFSLGDNLIFEGYSDFETADDVLDAAFQVGDNVEITLDALSQQTLVLEGASLSLLANADIVLGDAGIILPPFGSFIPDDLSALL